jgi:hypothetical protein
VIRSELIRFEEILKRRIAELEQATRHRDGIGLERNAGQLDELRQATERALAISGLDRNCAVPVLPPAAFRIELSERVSNVKRISARNSHIENRKTYRMATLSAPSLERIPIEPEMLPRRRSSLNVPLRSACKHFQLVPRVAS